MSSKSAKVSNIGASQRAKTGLLKDDSEFFNGLFKKFDRQLTACIDRLQRQMNFAAAKVEEKLENCENRMLKYVSATKKNCIDDLNVAEVLVNKELRSKIIMSQWTNKFLAASEVTETLDPISFAFSRLSLNVCLSFHEVTPQYLLQSHLHKHLIDFIALDSALVVGPALMALVHISLYPQLKSPIVAAGALPVLLKVMAQRSSKPLLAQSAKLCASLAADAANKTLMAQSGCMHALFDLLLGTDKQDVDRHIQYAALSALVNVIHRSDANRMLSIELAGVKPILTLLQTTSHDDILIQGIRALANIAYNNGYTANCILVAGGGEVLVEILQSGDSAVQQPLVAHSVLAAFANMCNSEVNQSHIGAIRGLLEIVLRICEYSRETYLATEAANFLVGACWNNTINKARIAQRNGCTVLMKRIMRHATAAVGDTATTATATESISCTVKMSLALASMLLYKSNHERMIVIGGLEECIRLCKVIQEPLLLQALSKIVSTMVPDPADLLRIHMDDSKHNVEKFGALPVLKKAKLKGFAHQPTAPDWLESAIGILSAADAGLSAMKAPTRAEFVEKSEFSREFPAPVHPDATVLDTKEFRGLLFSIY